MSGLNHKFLAVLLSMLMVIEMLPGIVFATENEEPAGDEVTTESTEAADEETVAETAAETEAPADETEPDKEESESDDGDADAETDEDSTTEETEAEEVKDIKTDETVTDTEISEDAKNGEGSINLPFVPAKQIVAQGEAGECGENLTWVLYEDGELMISGQGAMTDFEANEAYGSNAPWAEYKDDIKSLLITEGVTSIGAYAFCRCTNMRTVSIPLSVTKINYRAFRMGDNFDEMVNDPPIKDIYYASFATDWRKIDIEIDNYEIELASYHYSFSKNSGMCGANVSWTWDGKGKVTISGTGDMGYPNDPEYTTPFEYMDCIKSIEFEGNGITSICYRAFFSCYNITSIEIPESVNTIDKFAFANCTSLASVVLPENLTKIPMQAFYNCKSLKSIDIPGKVTEIGNEAFTYSGIESIVIPKSVKSVKYFAFAFCEKLTSVTMSKKLYETGCDERAFEYSDNIEFTFFTDTLEYIYLPFETLNIAKGKSYRLTASGTSVAGYKSSNSKIAKIDSKGLITALKPGTVTITAYLKSNPAITATCKVTVKYKVIYNLNGGTNNSGNLTWYTGTLKLKNPSKTNYVFKGWYADKKFKKKVTSVKNANKTVYAKWAIKTYTVKFYPNGGKGKAYTQKCNVTKTYNLTANKFSRKGYTFIGWNTKANGTGTTYTNKQQIKDLTTSNGKTISLYAQWRKNNYNIYYSGLPAGSTNPNPKTFSVTSTVKFKNPSVPGYSFKGWYSNSKKTKKITTIYKGSTGSRTIYAKVVANKYNVSFNANGGTGKMAQKKAISYASSFTLPKNAFKRDGYAFVCWNTKADGSGAPYYDAAQVSKLTTKNGGTVTLYAQWEKIAADPVVEPLQMNINEVAQSVLSSMGEGYSIFENDKNENADILECNKQYGMVNYVSFGKNVMSNEPQFNGYKSIYVCFDVYEFDMNSQTYKDICSSKKITVHLEGQAYKVCDVAAINKQYVLVAKVMYGTGYGFEENDPEENTAPYSIDKVQAGYEAFVALK